VLSFLLHHDSTISDDVKTKVGNLLKRKLLKGLTFKEVRIEWSGSEAQDNSKY
jgi:hypothetical protein